jgi:hypothetical protein
MNHLAIAAVAAAALAAAAAGQTWTVSAFGLPCGATLQAQVLQAANGAAVAAGITAADPLTHAILVIGSQQPAPVALPGGCQLLVHPRLLLHTRTDASGTARVGFRLPPVVPITVDLQALVLTRSPTGRLADASNGVRIVGT